MSRASDPSASPIGSQAAVIIGAGRTGRGLAAVLCQRSQVPVILVDRDQALVDALRAAGSYAVSVLGSRPAQTITIRPRQVHQLGERSWHRDAERARVLFTAVFGTNLAALAADLAAIALARHAAGAGPLDIITCENLTHAARVLREATAQAMPAGSPRLEDCRISFVEAMVLTTSLASADAQQPLTVRTQNAFRLPCDGDALQAGNPGITGLEALPRFGHQLQRKIYTYNGINAVISYLGAQRGHLELAAATRDPEIAPVAILAGQEASAALIAEYGFSAQEQLQWQTDALAKFADEDIPDPILRNAADPARKLARDDRLVGPALLALKHGLRPQALARGIVAAAEYRTPSEPSLLERWGSLEAVLTATAGLEAGHPLLGLIAATAWRTPQRIGAMTTLMAAIDLGTSRIRLGVLATDPPRLEILSESPNLVEHGPDGAAQCRFSTYLEAVEQQLAALAQHCRRHQLRLARISLTGQVSSLLRFQGAAAPLEDSFPIWMDTTCREAVPELARLWEGARGRAILGTCMPAASNWLAVKIRDLHNRSPLARGDGCRYLQVQDAIFQHLTGAAISHPSVQISLVDHRHGGYAPEMLSFLGLDPSRLPALEAYGQRPLLPLHATRFGLPETIIHVAPQDTHAALFGMCAGDGDGMLLAGTSEIIGVCEAHPRSTAPARMVSSPLGDGWMVYGSSSSGGSSIDWLMKSVLRRGDGESLQQLSLQAEAIAPGSDGLICLPYFSGERAPLWNHQLTGALLGLRAHHTDAHLLRAVLESVAYGRRQAAEAMECPLPARFLAAGGGTVSALWNAIRATVLERPLLVMTTPDLALIGAIRWIHRAVGAGDEAVRSLSSTRLVEPHAAWREAYRTGYAEFCAAQRRLQVTGATAAPLEATHA